MHQVQLQLSDHLYNQAKKKAIEAGFETVDAYIADVVSEDLAADTPNLDHLFSPERIAHIDRVVENVKSGGKTHTAAEVGEHFRKRFKE